jgi:hypothetical protein
MMHLDLIYVWEIVYYMKDEAWECPNEVEVTVKWDASTATLVIHWL